MCAQLPVSNGNYPAMRTGNWRPGGAGVTLDQGVDSMVAAVSRSDFFSFSCFVCPLNGDGRMQKQREGGEGRIQRDFFGGLTQPSVWGDPKEWERQIRVIPIIRRCDQAL